MGPAAAQFPELRREFLVEETSGGVLALGVELWLSGGAVDGVAVCIDLDELKDFAEEYPPARVTYEGANRSLEQAYRTQSTID